MKLLLCLIALASAQAGPAPHAHGGGSTAEAKDPAFKVSVDADFYSPEAFRAKGFRTEAMAPEADSSYAPPANERREEVFSSVPGLASAIAEMDALDRDLLYIRAKNYDAAKLEAIYPAIDSGVLAALRSALK